jgi:hypothetical protein
LINDTTGETVVEWWDDDAREMIEDGFIDLKNLLGSLMRYARDHKLFWKEDRPLKAEN